MPNYRAQGVYVQEISAFPDTVSGVPTSTAAFVGVTERGPLAPTLTTSWADFERRYGGLPPMAELDTLGYLSHAVQGFFDNGGQRAWIARVHGGDPDERPAANDFAIGEATVRLTALGPGIEGGDIFAKFAASGAPGSFDLQIVYFRRARDLPNGSAAPDASDAENGATGRTLVEPDRGSAREDRSGLQPQVREAFEGLSFDPAAPNFVERRVNEASFLLTAKVVPKRAADWGERPLAYAGVEGAWTRLMFEQEIAIRSDDMRAATVARSSKAEDIAEVRRRPHPPPFERPTAEAFVGAADPPRGLKALATVQDCTLLCIPDQGRADLFKPLAIEMQRFVEASQRCFAILQFPEDAGPVADIAPPIDCSYAAIYYPWINIQDPTTGDVLTSPPSGHIAGVFARTDTERGVHKAPANEEVAGLLASGVNTAGPLAHNVTAADMAVLNPQNVNCLRDLRRAGRGVRVWGARTTSTDPAWRYVSVRRLLIYLEQSIQANLEWVVFEPNGEALWRRIEAMVSSFLSAAWREGALQGATTEAAFFVKCDRTTMTQADMDDGRLIALIGVAPIRPAEFVIFQIGQKTADASD